MNGYDIARWLISEQKMRKLGITYKAFENIHLYDRKNNTMGTFQNSNDLFYYLCGYEYGLSIKE